MSAWLRRSWARLVALFRKQELDGEFDAELEHHLELATADNMRRGMTPAEARRQALLALGGVTQAQELHREVRGVPWLEHLGQDVSYALRSFRREPSFTIAALVILVVGIGLNTTVFSLVRTVILRPLPLAHAERLMWISNGGPTAPRTDLSTISSTVNTWEYLQRTNASLERLEAFNPFSTRQTFRLTGGAEPETVLAVQVSPGLFDLLGVHPQIGRGLLAEDGLKNAPPRLLLSHALWQRRFGSDPGIVGQTVQVNGTPVVVIGVMPAADPFASVFFPAIRVDAYAPLVAEDARNWGNTLALIGRAKPGVPTAAVDADMGRSIAQFKLENPGRGRFAAANARNLQQVVRESLERPLLFLWLAAGAVLAIVALNVGGLLLARGAARAKELSVRCALGAGRGRIARQLLTECLLLVGGSAVIGTALAWGALRFLATRSAVEIPLLNLVHLDGVSVAFTALLCLVTAVGCGALPAWRLSRAAELNSRLVENNRGSSGGRAQTRLRSVLVVAEIALACVLAVGAGLVVRSLLNVLHVDLGFRPEQLVAIRIDSQTRNQDAFLEAILRQTRALPGVQAAGLTDCLPVERDRSWGISPVVPDAPNVRRGTGAHLRLVTEGLFDAMGIRLVAGRDFAPSDGQNSPTVIVINQTLANQFWPGENAVGREVIFGNKNHATVIAVAADVHHSGPEVPPGGEMYLSVRQVPDSMSWDLMIRTTLPPAALVTALRESLREVDATLPLSKVRRMTDVMAQSMSSRRLLAALVGGFAVIALGLAALGLYGVISYAVTQQRREFGIRLALGAGPRMLERQVIGRTMRLAGMGIAGGLVAAAFVAQSLRTLLFGVSPANLGTYACAALGLLVCALAAAYVPARRAGRVDALEMLRNE